MDETETALVTASDFLLNAFNTTDNETIRGAILDALDKISEALHASLEDDREALAVGCEVIEGLF